MTTRNAAKRILALGAAGAVTAVAAQADAAWRTLHGSACNPVDATFNNSAYYQPQGTINNNNSSWLSLMCALPTGPSYGDCGSSTEDCAYVTVNDGHATGVVNVSICDMDWDGGGELCQSAGTSGPYVGLAGLTLPALLLDGYESYPFDSAFLLVSLPPLASQESFVATIRYNVP